MSQNEESENRTAYAAVYEIIRFHRSLAKKASGLRNIEGVETWVDLHLRSTHPGSLDLLKEALVQTREGETYTVNIEGTHFINPTYEALQTGIWQIGDWMITVSGAPIEQLHVGDLLVQEVNAKVRPARRKKKMTD
jgi:hypothetical protein